MVEAAGSDKRQGATSAAPAASSLAEPSRSDEQAHYEAEYEDVHFNDPADPVALEALWTSSPYAPFNRDMLRLLGDLEGKTVLLLGNGVGSKELHLLTKNPARLIFSDRSAHAVEAVRRHAADLHSPALEFRPVDALNMPFADGEIDVLYGYAFVHHLPDLPAFLKEAKRVLSPAGRAVFMDNATVPAWQWLKNRPLKPIMRLVHIVNPISEEDLRVTAQGWYSVERLESAIRQAGGVPFLLRSGLSHYALVRLLQILHRPQWHWRGKRPVFRHASVLRALHALDQRLGRRWPFNANRIRLVWGFVIPEGDDAQTGAAHTSAGQRHRTTSRQV